MLQQCDHVIKGDGVGPLGHPGQGVRSSGAQARAADPATDYKLRSEKASPPVKIGIMLRHLDQHEGGVKLYTHKVLSHLFAMDHTNQYILLYQKTHLVGRYAGYPQVEEVVLPVPGTVLWDQIAVPWITKRKRLDLIFNPKFTVPFLSHAKKIFVIHGSEWFVIPETFPWYDRLYTRIFAPLYCQAADAIIAVSRTVKNDVVQFTGVDAHKVVPIYNGYEPDTFHVIHDVHRLQTAREKYRLPPQFILWVGQIYPPKNVERLLEAFWCIRDEIPHTLVLAGATQRWKANRVFQRLQSLGLQERVQFIGWVLHTDLPVLYNLAELFVLPSLYEGFGIPLLEAMACGCPLLTAKTASPPEVVGRAGYLVDPLDVNDIAKGMTEVLSNRQMRQTMINRGLERVKEFSWETCARDVLSLFEEVYAHA
jgi:glycosyltransferase involved in cell wall biosynthesis